MPLDPVTQNTWTTSSNTTINLPPEDSPDTSAAMGAWLLATFFALVSVIIIYGVSPAPFVVLSISFAVLSLGKAVGSIHTGALRRHDQALARIDRTLEAVERKVDELDER